MQHISVQAKAPRTGGNENTGLIKVIAIVLMIVDHIGAVFFPRVMELRVFGRIAFPLFAWCLCVGAEYTRNPWKYALRLLVVGLLSHPVYLWAMNHHWKDLNIFFELLLGLLAIEGIRFNRLGSRYWAPALAVLASCLPGFSYSYGWQGMLFILILYACRKQRGALAAGVISFCLFWGEGTYRLTSFFGVALPREAPLFTDLKEVFAVMARLQFWAVLSLPLILWRCRQRLQLPKCVSYAMYPAHMLVIGVIRHWGEIRQMLENLL